MKLWWFAFFIFLGCDKQEPGPAIFSLANSAWIGTFTPKSNKPLQKVAMQLQSDQRFVIDVKESKVFSEVKGKFTEYARNKVLVFDVEQSGYDLLGTKGSTYEYSYVQSENELTLEGANGRYLLMRENSEEDSGEDSNTVGDWTCQSESSAQIELNIDQNEFRGRRFESQRKTLFFEGSARSLIDEDEKPLIKLLIKSSNEPRFVDVVLHLKILDDKTAELSDPATPNASRSKCAKS